MTWFTQFARFSLVGGLATAMQYAILVMLVELTGSEPLTASSAGFTISSVFNYLLNRHYTFRSNRAHAEALPRFVGVALTGLAINAMLIWFVHGGLGLHYLVAQVIATGGTLVWTFAINRFWTFDPAVGNRLSGKEQL